MVQTKQKFKIQHSGSRMIILTDETESTHSNWCYLRQEFLNEYLAENNFERCQQTHQLLRFSFQNVQVGCMFSLP